MKQQGFLFVISAPSGTGKTSICNILQKKMPKLEYSISHTTRAPRPTEKNKIDYYFVSEQAFKAMIDHGDFIEWTIYQGNYYGTSRETVKTLRKDDSDILLDLDVLFLLQFLLQRFI